MGTHVPPCSASQPDLQFRSSPGWFSPWESDAGLKEGTEGVAEIREHPCEELHPQQIQFPPQRKIWDGTI